MKRPHPSALPEKPLQMTDPTAPTESSSARPRPVRVTVDLEPRDYDTLREFAFGSRMTHTDVLRSLVRLLNSELIGEQVRNAPVNARGGAR
jgi:hypothetical protein